MRFAIPSSQLPLILQYGAQGGLPVSAVAGGVRAVAVDRFPRGRRDGAADRVRSGGPDAMRQLPTVRARRRGRNRGGAAAMLRRRQRPGRWFERGEARTEKKFERGKIAAFPVPRAGQSGATTQPRPPPQFSRVAWSAIG